MAFKEENAGMVGDSARGTCPLRSPLMWELGGVEIDKIAALATVVYFKDTSNSPSFFLAALGRLV